MLSLNRLYTGVKDFEHDLSSVRTFIGEKNKSSSEHTKAYKGTYFIWRMDSSG